MLIRMFAFFWEQNEKHKKLYMYIVWFICTCANQSNRILSFSSGISKNIAEKA
jgi:hypothetical protein